MPLDRNSFRYKFEKAYARGWPLPEPKNKTQEKIRDDIIEVKQAIKLKKQQEFDDIMKKSPLTFDVHWDTADLIQAEGTISAELPGISGIQGSKDFGEVRLTRTRGTPLLTFIGIEELKEFPVILNNTAQILDHNWELLNNQLIWIILFIVIFQEWNGVKMNILFVLFKYMFQHLLQMKFLMLSV